MQAKPILGVAWKDVQVHVKDILSCRFAVCQEQVDPFTAKPAPAKRSGDALPDLKD